MPRETLAGPIRFCLRCVLDDFITVSLSDYERYAELRA